MYRGVKNRRIVMEKSIPNDAESLFMASLPGQVTNGGGTKEERVEG